ncbi:RNA polymerase subunit sigma-70 [Knoellia sinensis KCTC 19936]|uniref:RNA polymerase subunit sigma-70 n=1 Tax=Knoellia sinensis KCTC 19936 TaxID=1385520 RepID=A0A0A0J385_9MICO|nr:sigma-70 family RNA polymerase sigma factor [Knoellia sinensis]KGN31623.1 RNA polymerase subunit sigma-70 [Knoellia sinensis KCTC 19936]
MNSGLAAAAANAFSLHRSGDSSAMGALVDQVTPLLWHTARAQGADPATAEDVVQTTWLRLVEHAAEISDPQAVLQWLLMTTKRESWNAVRRGRRTIPRESWDEPTTSDTPPPTSGVDPALASEERELARAIWQHVERLPERCQQLLRLVAFVDRPDYSAVSEALGIPVGSIGPTRGRCLAKLRLALTADPAWEVTA